MDSTSTSLTVTTDGHFFDIDRVDKEDASGSNFHFLVDVEGYHTAKNFSFSFTRMTTTWTGLTSMDREQTK